MRKFINDNYTILLILIFFAILLFTNLSKPFIGHHDWNGAFWGEMTRRYLSIIGIRASDYLSSSGISAKSLFFPDYTPLLPLLLTFFSAIFGFNDFTLRLVPAVFSLTTIFFIYKIGELQFGRTVGLLASVFAAVTPMFLYFGKMPDHEPIVVSLITITFFFFLKSFKNRGNTLFFLTFLFLSLLESWPAFFLLPPIIFYSLIVNKEKISKIFPPVLLAIGVITFHLATVFAIGGTHALSALLKQGNSRMNSGSELIGGFSNYSTTSFITTEAHYAVIYFTRILVVLSMFWIIYAIIKIIRKKITKTELSLFVLLAYAMSFVLIFRQLAFIHDYKLFHFLPFISLSAAVFIFSILKNVKSGKIKIVIFAIISVLIFLERHDYLDTLQKTSFNTPGYELGLLIHQQTLPKESVLVNSMQFKAFFEVFVNYYADRSVDYEDINFENFKTNYSTYQKYKYLILIDGRNSDQNLSKYLETNYPFDKFGPYRFFNISTTI